MKTIDHIHEADYLGQVALQKDERGAPRIKEDDVLEIHIKEDGEIVLKKCSPLRARRILHESHGICLWN